MSLASVERNVRRHRRELLEAKLTLSWQDERGIARYSIGRCLDVSESGMRIEVAEQISIRSYVSFKIDKPSFQGSGSVRYCRRNGVKYHIGLEFAGGLRWQARPAT